MNTAVATKQENALRFVHVQGIDLMRFLEQARGFIENPKDNGSIFHHHWNEVAVHKEMLVLKPHYQRYMNLIQDDSLVIIGVYNGDDLVGYATFVLFYHLHYKDVLVANDDMYFIKKEFRNVGTGTDMIRLGEDVLRKRGVKFVQLRTKDHTAHEAFLRSLGYGPMDLCYCKVLEK